MKNTRIFCPITDFAGFFYKQSLYSYIVYKNIKRINV